MKTRAREEQILIGYLLGVASELEKSQIETRYFRDQDFYEEALALEEELICDYLKGALSFQERRLFEQNFLSTPRRRLKFQAAKRLMGLVADHTQRPAQPAQPEAGTKRMGSLFRPDPSLAWGLAAILLLGFCVWYLGLLVADSSRQLQASETERQTIQAQGKQLKDRLGKRNGSVQAKQRELQNLQELAADSLTASLDPPVEAFHTPPNFKPNPTPVIVAFTLPAPQLRAPEKPQQVALTAETDLLRLSFKLNNLDKVEFLSYNAALKTKEGQVIVRQEGLNTQAARQLTLEIPAKSLKSGLYVVTLTGVTANKEAKPADDILIQITHN